MLRAQTRLDFTLLIRNGEQLLLTIFIPVTLLIALAALPIGDFAEPRAGAVIPGILSVAVISTAFTGQAIAVGFDRRYGALKRLGATALPRWGIIFGKSAAVVLLVIIQTTLLSAIALALGWRPAIGALGLGVIAIALGTVTFSAMGLLLGGWLRAEIVLALANILWFILLAIGSLVLMPDSSADAIPAFVETIAHLSPSGALIDTVKAALDGRVAFGGVGILTGWALACGGLATRTFSFT